MPLASNPVELILVIVIDAFRSLVHSAIWECRGVPTTANFEITPRQREVLVSRTPLVFPLYCASCDGSHWFECWHLPYAPPLVDPRMWTSVYPPLTWRVN